MLCPANQSILPSPHTQPVNLASLILRTLRRFGAGLRSSPFLHSTARCRPFSSTTTMAAKIDGTAIARRIRERINHDIARRQSSNPRFQPSLTIIQGSSPPLCSVFLFLRFLLFLPFFSLGGFCLLTNCARIVGERSDSSGFILTSPPRRTYL